MSTFTKDPHNCLKCGKSFKYKSHLNKHLTRKTPCDPIVTIASDNLKLVAAKLEKRLCLFCNRIFSSTRTLNVHIKSSCPIAPTGKHNSSDSVKNADSVEDDIPSVPVINSIINSNNSCINSHNTYNITLQVHGNENLRFITESDVANICNSSITSNLLKHISEGDLSAITAASNAILAKSLSFVYNNPLHPENLNMFIPSESEFLTHRKIMTFKNDGWSPEHYQDVYESVTQTIINKLIQFKHPINTDYRAYSL
jgi:hypothetical protein